MTAHPANHPTMICTTCPYCGVGCGVQVTHPLDASGPTLTGMPDHPANFGRLCSKGSALMETVALDDRLLYPMMKRASGSYERVSWDSALDHLASGWSRIVDSHGPDATAFYLSGQLLTEDYYVANKLMKGFVGTANVDTNSRLCMASSVAGHRRAFGADVVPGTYEDLDCADLLVLVGSNAAWCHPILWQRMQKNRETRGAKLVLIDPRRSASAEDADLVLALKPGTDTILFSGLLVALADAGLIDNGYVLDHTEGYEAAVTTARALAPDIATTALRCGLSERDVAAFFRLFLNTPKAVTLYSQGVNQSAQGTDKVGAIINCHLATGRIGHPGMGPFSLTGQPNAMGGREVGGLANMLAAHMGFSPAEIDRVQRFWNAPRMAIREGLKAVPMFDAVAAGDIRALWVMGTNPAVSMPRADHVSAALRRLDLFVVSDVVLSNDTISGEPHLLLPARAWGEKDGTVTNSERRISRQRAFLEPPGETRPDWWIVAELGKRLGFADAFDWEHPAAIFREHAALSAFENNGSRDFDLGGLVDLADPAYEAMPPLQWPVRDPSDTSDKRFFAQGGFFTASGRGRFVTPETPRLSTAPDADFPFVLNTGRIRDQWHTMTRTGRSPRLAEHISEPFVAIHPADAEAHAIQDGGFAKVTSAHGEAILAVRFDAGQRRGEVFTPIHWSAQNTSNGRVGALVTAATDPFSGQPELKATPVRVAPVAYRLRGFILSRAPVTLPEGAWFARAAIPGGTATIFACDADVAPLFATIAPLEAETARFSDPARGIERLLAFSDGVVDLAAFVAPAEAGRPDAWQWLRTQFGQRDVERAALLAGRPRNGVDPGPTICACFGVGLNTIRTAIAEGAGTVEAIGTALKAGTNCGSCKSELKKLLA